MYNEVEVKAASEQEANAIVQERLDTIDNDEFTAELEVDLLIMELSHRLIVDAIKDNRYENVYEYSGGWNIGYSNGVEAPNVVYVTTEDGDALIQNVEATA